MAIFQWQYYGGNIFVANTIFILILNRAATIKKGRE